MADRIQPLNPAHHQHIRIKAESGFGHLSKVHFTPVVVQELADTGANFPVVFLKDDASGNYVLAALFSLNVDENLFVDDDQWQGTYIPLNLARLPFVIGPTGEPNQLGACIDTESSLISDEGNALFNEDGTETDLMKQATQGLARMFEFERISRQFINRLAEMNLLREFTLQMTYVDGVKRELTGLFTVHVEKLHALSGAELEGLNKEGFLSGAYAINHAFSQVKRLVRLHNLKGVNPLQSLNVNFVTE